MKYLRKSDRSRRLKNTATTRSGKVIKINQSISQRLRSNKLTNQARKAIYLSSLPKDRFHRILYKLHPRRLMKFWFSREGGIMALKILGVSIVIGFFLTIGLFAYFRKDLPKIKDLSGNIGGSITYYDRTGKTVLWQDYDAVKRVPVASDQISIYVKQATIAIEDKDFYTEGAFDIQAIIRAALNNVFGGGNTIQGGSTITQQLVKLTNDWVDNRTVTRKLKELILAVELERQYSKDDILTGYLNRAPYGGVTSGIESAALDYFNVNAKDLTLAEAALLASIPKSPSYYSPYSSTLYNPSSSNSFNREALLGRQQYTLDQMVKQKYITKAQAEEAKKVDVLALVQPLKNKYNNIKAPYFVLAAKKQLEQKYTAAVVDHGGWKVITTLDLDIQAKAEELIKSNLVNVKRHGGDVAATVVEQVPTGQISALVGGVDFTQPDYGELNFADQVLIAPGSSFKPYNYTALINDKTINAGAGSVFYDSQGPIIDPETGAGYACTDKASPRSSKNANCLWDFDLRYPGPLTLRYALGGSRNVPAVKAMIQAGVSKTISLASAMMDNEYLQSLNQNTYNCYKAGTNLGNATAQDITQCYASSAIGDGAFLHLDDHVNGLATLARMGSAIPRTFILQIKNSNNSTIYNWTQPKGDQVISADTAYIMNDMLSDPNASYLSSKFHRWNGWNFAIKTGTTNNSFDGLMTSWSTQYAIATWVGHHTRNKTLSGFMENLTQPITQRLMQYIHKDLKPVNWVKPSTVKSSQAFIVTNHVGVGSVEPSPATDLFPGWYTIKNANTQITDKVSGLIATNCTPDLAKSSAGSSNTSAFSIDWFMSGTMQRIGLSGVTATDNVHLCGDTPIRVTLTGAQNCVSGSSCTFTVTTTAGTHPFNNPQYSGNPGTINLLAGGIVVATSPITDNDCTTDATQPLATCTVLLTYTPSSYGLTEFTAQVIDSVLYSASDVTSVSISATPLGNLVGKVNGTTTNFSWSGGIGPYTVYDSLNTALAGCTAVAILTCKVTPNTSSLALAGMSATVKDSSTPVGSATATITN